MNTAFFSDLPITRAVEIHVNLIDEFWKQLRLEGHKNDFLQDYRLALLDVMAHLCEMYRRSIPPDIPLTGTASVRSAGRSNPPIARRCRHESTQDLHLALRGGNTPNSMRALKILRNILETEFRGVYALKVIDVLKNLSWPKRTRSSPRQPFQDPAPTGAAHHRRPLRPGTGVDRSDLPYDELADNALNSGLIDTVDDDDATTPEDS